MKTLILLRHAKSGWDDPRLADFDRPINARGQRAAAAIGSEIKARGLRFDAVIASPARRVVDTVEAVSEASGSPLRPRYEEELYLASETTLVEFIQATADEAETLLVIGHNPGIEELVLLLTDDRNTLRSQVTEKYPTAALAEIAFPLDHWRDVAPGAGRLTRFTRPRDLDPELGPEPD